MTGEERNYFNRINKKREENIPLFGKDVTQNIHEKVVNRILRKDQNQQFQQRNQGSMKAEAVIQADIVLRKAVKDLTDALTDLKDKDIAQKLIAEHIFMLNNIFKMFE